jgi:hypothetical protein
MEETNKMKEIEKLREEIINILKRDGVESKFPVELYTRLYQ